MGSAHTVYPIFFKKPVLFANPYAISARYRYKNSNNSSHNIHRFPAGASLSSSNHTHWDSWKRTCFLIVCIAPVVLYALTQTAIELRFAFTNQQYSISDDINNTEGIFYLHDAQLQPDLSFGTAAYSIGVNQTQQHGSHKRIVSSQETRWIAVFPLTEQHTSGTIHIRAWLAVKAKNKSEIETLHDRAVRGELYDHSVLVRKPYKLQAFSFDYVQTRWLRKILRLVFDTKGNRKGERALGSATALAVNQACTEGSVTPTRCPTRAPVVYLGRGYGTFLGLGLTSWLTISIASLMLLIKMQRVS